VTTYSVPPYGKNQRHEKVAAYEVGTNTSHIGLVPRDFYCSGCRLPQR